jgi:hypothetical protein
MTDSMSHADWDRWSDEWRAERIPDSELAALPERTARARRAIAGMRALSLSATALSLLAVAGALYHAANIFELTLGLVVAVGIFSAWAIDNANQRDAHEHAERPPQQYLRMRRVLNVRRIRFARLVCILAALDLVFLLPWWIGGFKVHGYGFHLMQVGTLWAPLAIIIGSVVAASRMRATALPELQWIEHAADSE